MSRYSKRLSEAFGKLQVIDEISPRSKDSIVGFGEKLGCKIITAVLRDRVRSLRPLFAFRRHKNC
jgi:aspartokinase